MAPGGGKRKGKAAVNASASDSAGSVRQEKLKKKQGSSSHSQDGAASSNVDPTAVFVRGLPKGTADEDLRTWLEGQIGPTVTCFVIRDDYGLVKFKQATDARRCLEELQGADFQDSKLRLEPAKSKRSATSGGAAQERSVSKNKGNKKKASADNADAGEEGADVPADKQGLDLSSVQLRGVPEQMDKAAVQTWIETRLPGGCGIEHVRRVQNEENTYVAVFRKEQNASRAMKALNGAEMEGKKIAASFRALELSKASSKAGRLIIRNIAFSATVKHIRKAFEKLGTVADVHLPMKTGSDTQHRGFGFVQYADLAVAEKAVKELNGVKICGRGVAVDWSVESKLYSSLRNEEQRQQQKSSSEPKESAEKSLHKDDDDEDEDENEDDEEEYADEEEEEEDDEEKDTADEVKRMKSLMGGDDDEDAESDDESAPETPVEKSKKKKQQAEKGEKKQRAAGFDVQEGRSVFIRNVPFDATEDELRGVLKRFGRVASVRFVADKSGQNAHRGSCFVKFFDADGCKAVLAAEDEAERRLKELSAVAKKSDRRELPAVEGFGIALKGRRLVIKEAMTPDAVEKLGDERSKKKDKDKKKEDKREWMHLLNVGAISENSDSWKQLSKSEQRQRLASMKERKFRVNNPNFVLDPLRLSIRNLPRSVDATKLRDAVVRHIGQQLEPGGSKKQKAELANAKIAKVSLVRDNDRRGANNERRSKGFGFIAFKDHQSAMKTLELLNNNSAVFGGDKRPIVEFAVEDKRKLRMQQELYQKHAHKLKPGLKDDAGKGGADGSNAIEDSKPKKHKKKFESRGKKQREKRRAQKAAEAEKAARQQVVEAKKAKAANRKREEAVAQKALSKKPKRRDVPDAAPESERRPKKRRVGELADDFELQRLRGR
eukprot:TRINITY_DN1408_c0_g1_i1.p1 TRINITY_DN1408_c0_g1~~TRINITY_DN1408_c0_g1_i1.p1  ORF type:complete len:889 (+),score=219.87 TRINITY_DN1408_c0_g1_i1:57-2723(+)